MQANKAIINDGFISRFMKAGRIFFGLA